MALLLTTLVGLATVRLWKRSNPLTPTAYSGSAYPASSPPEIASVPAPSSSFVLSAVPLPLPTEAPTSEKAELGAPPSGSPAASDARPKRAVATSVDSSPVDGGPVLLPPIPFARPSGEPPSPPTPAVKRTIPVASNGLSRTEILRLYCPPSYVANIDDIVRLVDLAKRAEKRAQLASDDRVRARELDEARILRDQARNLVAYYEQHGSDPSTCIGLLRSIRGQMGRAYLSQHNIH